MGHVVPPIESTIQGQYAECIDLFTGDIVLSRGEAFKKRTLSGDVLDGAAQRPDV